MPRVRTAGQAAAWIEQVGLALLLPKADVALPSLWEQINGSPERNWAIRDADGGFVEWTPAVGVLWRTKDELPARGLACVGRHAAGGVVCVAPRLVPHLAASAGGAELDALEEAIAAAIDEDGPLTAPALRELLGVEKKAVERALGRLHRMLVLTNGFLADGEAGWGALAHDLVARKWPSASTPSADDARRTLAAAVLASSGELSAADVKGIFGWRIREAEAALDAVAESREEDGFRIWASP